MSNKSVFGLNENLAGMVAYLGFFITGIIVLVLEKENKFVRFCALQSTILFGGLFTLRFLVRLLLGRIFIIGGLLNWGIGVVIIAAWVYLSYTAYKGQTFKVPVLGDACYEQVNK